MDRITMATKPTKQQVAQAKARAGGNPTNYTSKNVFYNFTTDKSGKVTKAIAGKLKPGMVKNRPMNVPTGKVTPKQAMLIARKTVGKHPSTAPTSRRVPPVKDKGSGSRSSAVVARPGPIIKPGISAERAAINAARKSGTGYAPGKKSKPSGPQPKKPGTLIGKRIPIEDVSIVRKPKTAAEAKAQKQHELNIKLSDAKSDVRNSKIPSRNTASEASITRANERDRQSKIDDPLKEAAGRRDYKNDPDSVKTFNQKQAANRQVEKEVIAFDKSSVSEKKTDPVSGKRTSVTRAERAAKWKADNEARLKAERIKRTANRVSRIRGKGGGLGGGDINGPFGSRIR